MYVISVVIRASQQKQGLQQHTKKTSMDPSCNGSVISGNRWFYSIPFFSLNQPWILAAMCRIENINTGFCVCIWFFALWLKSSADID